MLADRETVKLNRTDFGILGYLQDGRNIAPNMAAALDKDRNYINAQLTYLLDYGLVRKIKEPGVKRAGLYELTDRGRVAFEHRAEYDKSDPDAFDKLIEREVADE